MGKSGPKPGFKKQAAAAAQAAVAVQAQPQPHGQPDVAMTQAEADRLPAAYRENPAKLGGEALRRLGNRMGMAHSQMAEMSDEKLREQLKMITRRQYEEQEA